MNWIGRRSGRTRVRRIVGTTLVLVSTGGLIVAFGGSPVAIADDSTQANPNTFFLTGEGDAMFVEVDDTSLPLTPSVSASILSAQAAVNSLGQSTGFAGFPYLGSFLQLIPGTVNGLAAGLIPPVPPLPGYAASSSPGVPSASESLGPYILTSQSSQFASQADSGFGLTAGNTGRPQMSATANSVANPDGSVTVSATSGFDFGDFGPLDIGNVTSTESMTEQGSQAPTVTGTTDVGTVTVAGLKVGLDQNGLELLGNTLPLGAITGVVKTLDGLLSKAGVSVSVLPAQTTYVPGTTTIQSVTSGGIQVKVTQNVPTQGIVTVTYVLGRATVSAMDTAAPALPESSDLSGDGSSSLSTTPFSDGSSFGSTGGIVPSSPLPTPSTTANTTPAGSSPVSLGPTRIVGSIGPSTESFYLILLLAGLSLLVGSQIIRRLGLRFKLRT